MSKSRALTSVLAFAGDRDAARTAAASDIGSCAVRALVHGDAAVILDTARAVADRKTRTAKAIRTACAAIAAALLAQRRGEGKIEAIVLTVKSILTGEEAATVIGSGAVDAMVDGIGAAAGAIKPGEKAGPTFGAAAGKAWLAMVDAVVGILKNIDDAKRAAKKATKAASSAADTDVADVADVAVSDSAALALAEMTEERDALQKALLAMTEERDALQAALAIAIAQAKPPRKSKSKAMAEEAIPT